MEYLTSNKLNPTIFVKSIYPCLIKIQTLYIQYCIEREAKY